jgi:hypothetical protein
MSPAIDGRRGYYGRGCAHVVSGLRSRRVRSRHRSRRVRAALTSCSVAASLRSSSGCAHVVFGRGIAHEGAGRVRSAMISLQRRERGERCNRAEPDAYSPSPRDRSRNSSNRCDLGGRARGTAAAQGEGVARTTSSSPSPRRSSSPPPARARATSPHSCSRARPLQPLAVLVLELIRLRSRRVRSRLRSHSLRSRLTTCSVPASLTTCSVPASLTSSRPRLRSNVRAIERRCSLQRRERGERCNRAEPDAYSPSPRDRSRTSSNRCDLGGRAHGTAAAQGEGV